MFQSYNHFVFLKAFRVTQPAHDNGIWMFAFAISQILEGNKWSNLFHSILCDVNSMSSR